MTSNPKGFESTRAMRAIARGTKRTFCEKNVPMRRFRVVDSSQGLWAPIRILRARNEERALQWCFMHGYDLIEEVN